MKINSKKMKTRREQLGLSQQKLADRSKVGIATIKRLEGTDPADSPRAHTINQLASALEMSTEDLCSSEARETPERPEKLRGPQYNRKINAARDYILRTDLLSRRYKLSRSEIMNMMPIAFLLFAEEIQRKRRNKLKELNGALDAAGKSRHLTAFTDSLDASEFLGIEQQSIKNNELFAESFHDEERFWFDPYHGNPVSDHIVEKIEEIFSDLEETVSNDVIQIWSKDGPNNLPDDDFLDAELEKVSHGNSLCKTALRVGEITIDEIPDNAADEPEKFQTWLEDQAPYSFERNKKLNEFMAEVEI